MKGQLDSLRPWTFLVIDEERSIGPNRICDFRSDDKGKTLHLDILIGNLWLIQSQAQFGPASTNAAYKDAQQILIAVLLKLP